MKLKFYQIALAFLVISTVFAGAAIDFFRAHSENDNIRLEWKTAEENDVKAFVIERRTPQGEFMEVTSIQPKGNYSYYSYLDETAYKTNMSLFIYRLKIVDQSGMPSYSRDVSVSHSVSSVKRTWGSIKAMFR